MLRKSYLSAVCWLSSRYSQTAKEKIIRKLVVENLTTFNTWSYISDDQKQWIWGPLISQAEMQA